MKCTINGIWGMRTNELQKPTKEASIWGRTASLVISGISVSPSTNSSFPALVTILSSFVVQFKSSIVPNEQSWRRELFPTFTPPLDSTEEGILHLMLRLFKNIFAYSFNYGLDSHQRIDL